MLQDNNGYKLIRASRLIDGKGGAPIADGALLIQGSKIAAAGRRADVAAPDGASVETFDYPTMSIMPGMAMSLVSRTSRMARSSTSPRAVAVNRAG